ncbi:hypothetical protein C2I18_17525 [Paenibacillus sp. PK3_47]|uniref:hypothetical protein n=1 Tax=Paenibacillus sp. PK3_47 TaxID=2072642 RepID=UPI00201D7788|nr:hypothetical protein [Paenibacillus sp. PK3_47]UQZ35166.1 hypothetical protein C2I18_17525 [Paenibacillus sp. PK3_47]
MNSQSHMGTAVLKFIGKGLILLFGIPILSVWTAGSIVCACISLIAAVLGTFGWNGIAMNISPGYPLPRIASLPAGMMLAFILFLSFKYTRRCLQRCLRFISS